MKQILFTLLVASLMACTSNNDGAIPSQPMKLVAVVVDYSGSYSKLVCIDSNVVSGFFTSVTKTGGTVAHIAIQSNSNAAAVFISQVERLDTTNTTGERNVYNRARSRKQNVQLLYAHQQKLTQQVSSFLAETRKYSTSDHTDLTYGLRLAERTVCETLYTKANYKRFVVVLSDMVNDPPNRKRLLPSMDFRGATVILVRPSPDISHDSLQNIFNGSELHVFTTINSAISFINQQ